MRMAMRRVRLMSAAGLHFIALRQHYDALSARRQSSACMCMQVLLLLQAVVLHAIMHALRTAAAAAVAVQLQGCTAWHARSPLVCLFSCASAPAARPRIMYRPPLRLRQHASLMVLTHHRLLDGCRRPRAAWTVNGGTIYFQDCCVDESLYLLPACSAFATAGTMAVRQRSRTVLQLQRCAHPWA